MDSAWNRFNLYLMLAGIAVLLCGCKTGKDKKVETTLRVHAEATENTSFTRKVKIYKDESLAMKVHEMPMLSDIDLLDAKVVDTMGGGFAISLKFNAMGRWTLDQHTSLNIGRHLAIYAMWGNKPAVSRWLAAPIISKRTADGMIIFTPDATREEAEEIVRGLPHGKTESKFGHEAAMEEGSKEEGK